MGNLGGPPIDVHTDPAYLRAALEASGVGVWSFVGGAIAWDTQTCRLFGVDAAPTTYEAYMALIHPDDRELVGGRVARFLDTGEYEELEHRVVLGERVRWMLCRGMAIRDERGGVCGLMGLSIDITERKAAEQRLAALSVTDELTGLANRRRVHDVLAHEWQRCARLQRPMSAVMCDIDHFKEFNDAFGHLRGDDCLQRVGKVLAGVCQRATDLVARYGGEEFLVVLPDTPLDGAAAIAERMRDTVAELRIESASSHVAPVLTISAGVATMSPAPDAGAGVELVALADEALYRAKRGGRNRVELALTASP